MKRAIRLSVLLLIPVGFFSCEKVGLFSDISPNSAELRVNPANLVKVTSTGHNFDAPDEIPSGWTTFKYMNKTSTAHFFVLEKLPEGKTVDSSKIQIVPFFQAGMDFYRVGNFTDAFGPDGFGGLPDWFSDVLFTGGTGLIGPNMTATSTVNLEPGTYVIECYVKSLSGVFHTTTGMIDQIIVNDVQNGLSEPRADVALTISSTDGILLQEEIKRPGNHIFSVYFEDQTAYGNLLGHDVHLVKFNNGFNNDDKAILNDWMNWLFVDFAGTSLISEGLMAPSPAGISFLGGMQELPAGQTGYFNAVLTPGDYAFISEVDDPMEKNLYVEFTIN